VRDRLRLTKEEIARRIGREIPDGAVVNLGIGIPTLVAQHVARGREVIFHSENGIIGMGPPAPRGEADRNIIDASKRAVTLVKGASIVDHATSFAIVRGGYLDLAVLGAFQVSQHGDIANWRRPGDAVPGVGGAMDLCSGAKRVVVAMTHTEPSGAPKIVAACTYPLTAPRAVKTVYTDLAVIDILGDGLHLRELAPGWTLEEVQELTGAPLRADRTVPEISLDAPEAP
jgi:3-oxoacid CoA-transferase B subunit